MFFEPINNFQSNAIHKNKTKTKILNVRRVLLNLKISKNRRICKHYNKKLNVRKYFWTCSEVVHLENIYMRPEVNSNRFEISLQSKISLCCDVTSLSALALLRAWWNSFRCKLHFGQIYRNEILKRSEFSMQTVNASRKIKLHRIIKVAN